MEELTKQQEKEVINNMAKEFLEYRLGINSTEANVRRLAAHILQFEKEVEEERSFKKRRARVGALVALNQKAIITGVNACGN